MEIKIHYWDESLEDIELYKRIIKHELIHINLNRLLKKHMDPMIEIIPHKEGEYIWLEGKCHPNFKFKHISLFLFIKILLSSVADSINDIIYYIMERENKNNNIINMLIKNSIFVGYYFLRALNIISLKTHLELKGRKKNNIQLII